jgi:hypothetical protein
VSFDQVNAKSFKRQKLEEPSLAFNCSIPDHIAVEAVSSPSIKSPSSMERRKSLRSATKISTGTTT